MSVLSFREGSSAGGLRVLSVLMGVFLVSMGFGKLGWFTDSSFLVAELRGYWGSAPAASRWLIDTVAMPGAPLFARLVPLGELLSGAALVAGFRVRLAAGVALLMVLNFHVTLGAVFQWAYLTNGYGLPVLGSLAALVLGGRRLPFSISRAATGATEQKPGLGRMPAARWVALVAALVLLNVSLTFTNVWPTLAIRFNADLSGEMALYVLGLVLAQQWHRGPSRTALRWLAGLWVVLVVGRYVEVTTTSLYGRDINLYWDLRHIPSVGAMFAFVADPWLKVAVVASVVLVPGLFYIVARWALGSVAEATREARMRRVLGLAAAGVLLLSLARPLGARVPEVIAFADPVAPSFVRELGELAYEMSGAGVRDLGPPPVMRSDLTRVGGADVFLFFLESYGAVSWDRPEFVGPLAETRAQLAVDIADTGRGVVSAFVESTTFGGESWLAHISLLSGTEVRDQSTNVRLMAQERDTLVKVFGRHDYRTVAIMPGMLVNWPEGAFYGFDDIYDHDRLDYHGPPFGWWDVNDQFALARVDAIEIAPQPRAPVFLFFTTITTHAPFVPTPPYQPDWERVLTATPYDADALDRAWSAWPDWTNLGPSYLEALEYAFEMVGGYLRVRADRDLVMILIGDHQPPALVSGAGASWDVPIHVIANRRAVLDRLVADHGFVEGLEPRHPAVARMDTLTSSLLDAFGDGDGGC